MSELQQLEYQVREKKVFFITRYCAVGDDKSGGVSVTEEGEFRDPLSAQRAAVALMKADHAREGIPDDDPRLKGPEPLVYGDPASHSPG